MYGHILKYRLKSLTRDKDNMFWILIFPIVLSTLFYAVMGNLMTQEVFTSIPVALVSEAGTEVTDQLKASTDLFNFRVVDIDEAKDLLNAGEVVGYVLIDQEFDFIVQSRGMKQSIVRLFLNQYRQTVTSVTRIVETQPEQLPLAIELIESRTTFTEEVQISRSEPDIILVLYFALIAMTCMYGAYLGLREAVDIQANLSDLAARINLAPIHKMKTFLYSISAAIIIQVVIMNVLLAYLQWVLRVNLGDRTLWIYVTTFLGSVLGVLAGAFVGTVLKTSENMKNALVTIVSLGGAFLAGMMNFSMKYVVAQNMPILTILNPVHVLADAYYALYFFESYDRYWTNIIYILAFIVIFFVGTYLNVRRRKYASL